MSDVDRLIKLLIMNQVIMRAGCMGWSVKKTGDKITLRKKKSEMNTVEKNTSSLIDILFLPMRKSTVHNMVVV